MDRSVYEITSVVFDSSDPSVVYAAHNDPVGGVSKGNDGGVTWFDVSNGLGDDGFCQRGCARDLAEWNGDGSGWRLRWAL